MSEPQKEKTYFAERIRALRKQYGLTQKQVADRLQLERSTYAFYETGKTTPGFETLRRLSRLFGVTVDDLIGDAASPTAFLFRSSEMPEYQSRLENPPPGISGEEMALVLFFRQMSPLQKQKCLEFFEVLGKL
ncbi:MAG: helix-turn-helix transcriptional regulator [Clostridia bacterium]|nr:helix-turn-helix transcriptional regulator [Clostridia bacterium]